MFQKAHWFKEQPWLDSENLDFSSSDDEVPKSCPSKNNIFRSYNPNSKAKEFGEKQDLLKTDPEIKNRKSIFRIY